MLRRTPLKPGKGFQRVRPERVPQVLTPARSPVLASMRPVAGPIRAMPKGPVGKPGKGAATVAEQEWLDAIVEFGCVACWLDGHPSRPCCPHHLLRGGQRMGHLFTIPLCDPGHHQNAPAGMVCRHPYKARFEQRYGAEQDLLQLVYDEIVRRRAAAGLPALLRAAPARF